MVSAGVADVKQPARHFAQARAAHHPLDRDSLQAPLASEPLFEFPFLLAAGGEFSVGGLASHRYQPSWGWYPVGHPQTRSRT